MSSGSSRRSSRQNGAAAASISPKLARRKSLVDPAQKQLQQQGARVGFGEHTEKSEFLGEYDPHYIDTNVMPCFFFIIALFSVFCHVATGTSFLTFPAFYIAFSLSVYFWHWQAHHRVEWVPFNGGCYKLHLRHHRQTFPAEYFWGHDEALFKKINMDASSWMHNLPLASSFEHEALILLLLILILVCGRVFLGLGFDTIGLLFLSYFSLGFIGNYFHNSFHVKDHWLAQYRWFRELRTLHYIHHLGTARHNYGIIDFGIDEIFGSYQTAEPKKRGDSTTTTKLAAAEEEEKEKKIVLPAGMQLADVQAARRTSGLANFLLHNDLLDDDASSSLLVPKKAGSAALQRGFMGAIFVRILLVALTLAFYYAVREYARQHTDIYTTSLGDTAANNNNLSGHRLDKGHQWVEALTGGLSEQLKNNEAFRLDLARLSSTLTDVAVLLLILLSLLGTCFRSFIACFTILSARLLFFFVSTDVAPTGCMYPPPGAVHQPFVLPFGLGDASVWLISHVDHCASPHTFSTTTSLMAITGVELWRLASSSSSSIDTWKSRLLSIGAAVTGLALVFGQILILLSMRSVSSFDVLLGLLLARYSMLIGDRHGPLIDKFFP